MKHFYILIVSLFSVCLLQAQDYKFGKVSKEEVLEKEHPKYKEANAAVLFRKHLVYYDIRKNTGLTLVTVVHERIKIYNKEGFDWANKTITGYQNGSESEEVSAIKGYTYNIVDGKLVEEKLKRNGVFKEETNKYKLKTKFTMPAVSEGSVIEYTYTIRSPFVTSIDDVPLQFEIPVNRLEAEIKIPEFFGFRMHYNPKSPIVFPIDKTKESFTYNYSQKTRTTGKTVQTDYKQRSLDYLLDFYKFQKDDIPPLKKEVYVDYLQNYAAYLRWELQYTKFPNSPIESFASTWEDVAKSIYNDAGLKQEVNRTGFFDEDLDEQLAGSKDNAEKLAKVFMYVKSKIAWNDFVGFQAESGTRTAYKDEKGNTGDINLLLVSMLRYAGFNANPVLVSTKSHGIPIFPTRNGFNYVIAAVENEDNILLLDATDKNAAIGELPARAMNWQGRIIREDGTSGWVSLMPNAKSQNTTMLNMQFDDNMVLKGKSVRDLSGLHAKEFRDRYVGLAEKDYLKILEEDKGNIVVSGLDISKEKAIGENIRQTYNFELRDEMEEINGKIYLKPMVFAGLHENPFKGEDRNYPIFFDFPTSNDKIINILIPDGYKVESLPESAIVNLKEGAGVFKFVATLNGKFLRVESSLDMNDMVYIAQDYKALKNFYAEMVNKHSEAIVLSKS
ncbi:transglutaminase domain-containing protein [uncultured Salegentibacter sp.]|uniref:transglutaminase domain-containing protein n=1 Tax=uncultured Salegentibacter sp. TaxID=259320 RepID=UPI002594F018|nr:transglutaminase domain-containing protein [uncultured Salegentibacter sp.]